MSGMWAGSADCVVGIAVADLHLWQHAPIARSAEPDWVEAMLRPLREINTLSQLFGVPALCAGDIFDRPNPHIAVVNFAIHHLPQMIAIPGQHDLPYHSHEFIAESAYRTLELAQAIDTPPAAQSLSYIVNNEEYGVATVNVMGAGWEQSWPSFPVASGGGEVNVMLCHQYVYNGRKTHYPGPPKSGSLSKIQNRLKKRGADVGIFGDNHIRWQSNAKGVSVWNCGSMMRRNSDQVKHKPWVGLVLVSGAVVPYELNCDDDKWVDEREIVEELAEMDIGPILEAIAQASSEDTPFEDACKMYCDKHEIEPNVRRLIMDAVGMGGE